MRPREKSTEQMSDQPPPPFPPPPPGEHEENIPPPPPPADETVSLEIDFEKLAERAALIAREQQQQQIQTKRKRESGGKKNENVKIPPPPMPPVSLGGTVLDEVDLEGIKLGDNRWGIALSSCVEYPNKKYFFRYDAFVGVVCFSQTE